MGFCGSGKNNNTTTTTLQEAQRRTWVLRIVFVISLLAAAAVCGFVSYAVVDGLEQDVGYQTYESVATSALENAQSMTVRKVKGSDAVASLFSYAFPEADEWPMIYFEGYPQTIGKIAALSSSKTVGVNVLVKPEEVEAFEAFAQQYYRDNGFAATAGVSEFGFGIWKMDLNQSNPQYEDGHLPDRTGETYYNSTHDILVPIFLHNDVNATSLMYNVHSDYFRGMAVDSLLDCADAAAAELSLQEAELTAEAAKTNASLASIRKKLHPPDCTVVSGFVELIVRPGPASLLYGPIYPAHDPTTIVALAATSIHWEEVLTNVVPDYVDGLDCVVSSDTGSAFTFVIHQGKPRLVGEGDLHDHEFDKWAHSVVLNPMETRASVSQTYTLTVYPTNLMLDEFRSNSPMAIALGFVGVILFCVAVFFGYDFFMRGESRQNKIILEMKRRFVRFVSHEIRTPLNTVCMGLELLRAELGSQMAASQKDGTPGERHVLTVKKHSQDHLDDNTKKRTNDPFSYLLDLTGDILDNSESAVTILNDLLNYDKIETGTFQLEVGVVPIWDLVRKTVNAFDIQARKRNVSLNFAMEAADTAISKDSTFENDIENPPKSPDFSVLNVVGDDMRLRQVILNLVSNSLKFVDEHEGVIDVTTSYHPKGLPGNRPLYTSKDGGNQHQEPISYPRDGSIRISVRDNGEGMTEEQQCLLFREGVQFDANKLQAGGGSGLGLYITKGLVEQHGGTISVESAGRGCGSTFTIEFPLYVCAGPVSADRVSNSSDGHSSVNPGATSISSTATGGGGPASATTTTTAASSDTSANPPLPSPEQHRHILVVDDAAMNRKMLIRLLEWAGHSCDSACNGREAVNAVIADMKCARDDQTHIPYDTILMDYEMPILNGPDATREIRNLGCDVFVVGVTGNVLLEDINYFKSKGADMVLAKPLNVAALNEAWSKFNR